MSENTETPIGETIAEPGAETPAEPKAAPKRGFTDHTITIRSAEQLRDAWQFALNHGIESEFAIEFTRMLALIAGFTGVADGIGYDLRGHVGYDGSMHSFTWYAEAVGPIPAQPLRDTKLCMNGGLIYHGRGSGETFAMTMTSGEERPWQIHT